MAPMQQKVKKFLGLVKRGFTPRPNVFDIDHPYGDNELLNYLSRYKIISNDRFRQDLSANLRLLSHPVYVGVIFDWQEVLDGTHNRANTNLLGEGNFGPVYRCVLPNCSSVGAVKFQDQETPAGHDEFVAELTVLQRANHVNVIRLLGKSFGRNTVALIYEFMPNGSVDHHLLRSPTPPGIPFRPSVMDWEMRMRMALGVGEALVYLHNELKMIHRDVKVENILLDRGFVPKLTDFGLAIKIVEGEDGRETEREVNLNKGTLGCVAPETMEAARVSTKSDVYSYGVFLFQLVTGRKAYDSNEPPETRNLTDWLEPVWRGEEQLTNVIDNVIRNTHSVEGLSGLVNAARRCTDPQPNARPTMVQVLTMVREHVLKPFSTGLSSKSFERGKTI